MAVRFLPPPEERSVGAREERADLAEVIELRSTLSQWLSPQGDREQSISAGPGDACHADSGDGGAVGAGYEVESETPIAVSPNTGRTCAEDGVRLLARRAKSSGELRDSLLKLSHEPHEVESVIEEFELSHYLDDAGLARLLTEKLRETKGASRSQIRMKLRERKLPDQHIEAAIGELDVDEEYALLRDAAENRAGKLVGLDRQTAERRLLGFLARRGWSGEPAVRAAREALDATGSGRGGSRAGAPSGVRFTT